MTLEQASTSGQRQRLNGIAAEDLSQRLVGIAPDFEPAPGVENWLELEQHGILFLRPGGNGLHTERRFLSLLAERYYSLVHDIIRKYDQRALISDYINVCTSGGINARWSYFRMMSWTRE